MPVDSKRGYDVTVISRMGIVLMSSKYLPSKSSDMVRIPNVLIDPMKQMIAHWRSGNRTKVEQMLQESIALLETGDEGTLGPLPLSIEANEPLGNPIAFRLPARIDSAWRGWCGSETQHFARYAILCLLIRERGLSANYGGILPWKITTSDGAIFYELEPTMEAAAASAIGQCRAGVTLVNVRPGWI